MILNDAMLWRMIWKEYRAQRGYWLVIAGFSIVLMLLFMWFLRDNDPVWFLAPWTIAFSLPAVYALGCAAVVFATEQEDGTLEMLQIMAARTSRVFWGKVSFSFVSTLAMSLVLLAAALVVTGGTPFRSSSSQWGDVRPQVHATLAMTVLFLAWGFLFSAIFRKALTAVCMTAAIPLAIFLSTGSAGFWTERSVVDIWYWGLALVVPLVAAAYVLTDRAIAGRSREWSWPQFRVRSRSAVNPHERLAAVKETTPTWRRTIQRLVWLELRHMLSVGHVLWIVTVSALVLWPMLLASAGGGLIGIGGIVMVPLFMGVWTFQAEAGRRTRFLADHGLSPQVVWLTKQFVWGLTTFALAVPFLVAVAIGNARVSGRHTPMTSAFHGDVPGASATTYVLLLGCLAYGAGQFASMLIPRGVTAGFVAWAMFAALAPWTWFMISLRVPVELSVVPLIVILIAATLGWSRNWLLEQATAKSYLRLALVLVSAVVLVWAGVGVFRIYEVPRPDFVDAIAPLREAHGQPLAPDEIETANLYRQIHVNGGMSSDATEILINHADFGRGTAVTGWEQATDAQRQLLADNQEALRQVLAATARQRCAFNDPQRPISELSERAITPQTCQALTTLILLSARELESQGKLDAALGAYVAVLRFARHVAGHGTMLGWEYATAIERRVGAWIVLWAAHPDQTPERIDAAVQRIGQETAQFPALRGAVLTQQFMIRRTVQGDWSELLPMQQGPQADVRSRTEVNILDLCFPWERARAVRVVDLVGAAELHCLDVLDQGLATPGFDMQHLASLADAVPATDSPKYRATLNQKLAPPQNRLGMGDFFGLHSVAGMQPERVPWNWVNSTYPLDERLSHNILPMIWDAGLSREVWLRAMFLRLKLTAYKKAHGEYPELLDASVLDIGRPAVARIGGIGMTPPYSNEAIDPYTGTEFGYRREGFPFRIHVSSNPTLLADVVLPGQPIIWSVGPLNVRQFTPAATEVNLVRKEPDGSFIRSTEVRPVAHTSALIFTLP